MGHARLVCVLVLLQHTMALQKTAPGAVQACKPEAWVGSSRSAVAALTLAATLCVPASADAVYLPRALFPGTYGNFCGPTPEFCIERGCAVEGRRGSTPIDFIDAACLQHDIEYCACDAALQKRRGVAVSDHPPPLAMSTVTAVRGLVGDRLLRAAGGDDDFAACSHRADVKLIREGIEKRSAAQTSACAAAPRWLCKRDLALTLGRFERVDLWIFERALDFVRHRVLPFARKGALTITA